MKTPSTIPSPNNEKLEARDRLLAYKAMLRDERAKVMEKIWTTLPLCQRGGQQNHPILESYLKVLTDRLAEIQMDLLNLNPVNGNVKNDVSNRGS